MRGSGGSTFPGRIARAIDPDVLRRLAAQHTHGNVVISGTNGKTTTAKMISDILVLHGYTPAHNRTGANLIYGITSEFVRNSSIFLRMKTDIGLAEVDEATMPAACAELNPVAAVVTNFFRDQLDRFGELETTVSLVRKGLDRMSSGAVRILCADDPLCASLAEGTDQKIVFYGIDAAGLGESSRANVQDVKRCPACGEEYVYSSIFYAHLGVYECPGCGRKRPVPQVRLLDYRREGTGSMITIDAIGSEFSIPLRLPGIYNAYNALAAVACTMTLGVEVQTIRAALSAFSSSFGRMELIPVGSKSAFIALVKNPTGFNEVIRTLLEGKERRRVIIAINDRYADGRDVSWLWDVDFERMAESQDALDFIVTSGIRADDMAVRLKYAGIDEGLLLVEPDIQKALVNALERTEEGGLLYILPTYTAMLEFRSVLHKMGHARQFWEV
jgi:UDP-N-acetylmuramyl tripeptide synthase